MDRPLLNVQGVSLTVCLCVCVGGGGGDIWYGGVTLIISCSQIIP